mmetsp:Transcript_9954/g.24834  ORF Transcript_9954/g.24834 Transcript_9954/m.24834 type:complete len:618 (-) Transcript_9954:1517-3370(-)|eukprot:CAMPEP_0116086172 /NCGR_PEP_ID=MMETSP0327-20121206/4715_1 /TAXON_ID=44447 /ORGANISM="Pseudo-nitzschia delicatissima, Strain B596" /LENGTH=617 /DNA_ID=CAMNT_0003577209 /DNA_START=287 /DNA_END=2140 /DNA_ORIENTATION=-
MAGTTDNSRGRSSSPRPRTWSAAESDKCECVLQVQPDDVLLGRGSGPNDHVGNIKFRDLVHERKAEYLSTNHRQTKALIAKDIVDQVYGRGGRFLKKLSHTEASKVLPKLLAENGLDDAENDRTDSDKPGPCDVYQIQKHSTVMEKAKQALRQNQRNTSPDMPENRGMSSPKGVDSSIRQDSMGRANNAPSESPRNGIHLNSNGGNNNWNGMSMGNMGGNMGGGFNDNSLRNHNNPRFQGNNLSDTFEMQNSNFNNSPQGRNQESYQQQLFQQHQNLLDLQQQHEMLQLQFQQQRQQQQTQQQLELETHNKLLQEQLELQIRQEQLRQLQQRSLQNIANSAGTYSNRQQEPEHTQSQSSPPAVLNGYATYTTTLDAIEDSRHNSNDGLADHDDKSMQMSTMMGSFKDMSVKDGENESMHGSSGQSIGTIEGVGIPAGFGSNVHMSGISMMSMMNDSTDSLFKNPQKAGNDVGGKNASWGNSSGALADVIESNPNPAAVAAAAVLGKKVPGFEKAQRRWSGGFIPAEVPQTTRRVNRRGSLQYTSNNMSNHNPSHDLNQMQATASAMLAMAQADHERQQQSFNYLNSPNDMNNYGGHEMMNQHSQGYNMDGMNNGYRN